VIAKLVINLSAVVVLLFYVQTLSELTRTTSSTATSIDEFRSPSSVLHGTVALVLLIAATALSVYKPRGLTRYGQRRASVVSPSG
jgi:hypothetical protein